MTQKCMSIIYCGFLHYILSITRPCPLETEWLSGTWTQVFHVPSRYTKAAVKVESGSEKVEKSDKIKKAIQRRWKWEYGKKEESGGIRRVEPQMRKRVSWKSLGLGSNQEAGGGGSSKRKYKENENENTRGWTRKKHQEDNREAGELSKKQKAGKVDMINWIFWLKERCDFPQFT